MCKLDEYIAGQKLALFKMGGVQIMNEDIMVKQEKRKWNIGNYLLMSKKSAGNIKIGVGHTASESDEVSL